jgi:hypothetical protein
VWSGKASDGALPDRFFGHRICTEHDRMRDYHDEADPKTPHPVWRFKKRSNPSEASEAIPIRKDHERDRHLHVV